MKENDKIYQFLDKLVIPEVKNKPHKQKLKESLYREIDKPEEKSFFVKHPVLKYSFSFILVACVLIALFIPLSIYFFPKGYERITEKTLTPVRMPEDNDSIVTFLYGDVFLLRGNIVEPLEVGDIILEEDTIKVSDDSYCELEFSENAIIKILENTIVTLDKQLLGPGKTDVAINIDLGAVLFKIDKLKNDEQLLVKTGHAVMGIRGTVFLVRLYDDIGTLLAVKDGKVDLLQAEDKDVPVLLTLFANQEILIKKSEEVPGDIEDLSDENNLELLIAEKMKIHKKGEEEKYLVKIILKTEPGDADIFLNEEYKGKGKISLLAGYNEKLNFLIKRDYFKETTLNVTALKDIEYTVSFEKMEPVKESDKTETEDKLSEEKTIVEEELEEEIETEEAVLQEEAQIEEDVIEDELPGGAIQEEEIITEEKEPEDIAGEEIDINDRTFPFINDSDPSNGANNVLRKKTITIIFSEPMKNSWSIQAIGGNNRPVSYEWIDSKTLKLTYLYNFDPNTTYTIILNPKGHNFYFQDLAGNLLAPDTIISFRTGFLTEEE